MQKEASLNIVMINVFFHIAWGAMGTSAFIFASMLAILWHSRHALVGVFWTDQAGEPANVRRYYRTIAAVVVLLVIILMGFALWLSAGSDFPVTQARAAPHYLLDTKANKW